MNLLQRLARQAQGETPMVMPRVPSRFESGAAGDRGFVVQETEDATRQGRSTAAVTATPDTMPPAGNDPHRGEPPVITEIHHHHATAPSPADVVPASPASPAESAAPQPPPAAVDRSSPSPLRRAAPATPSDRPSPAPGSAAMSDRRHRAEVVSPVAARPPAQRPDPPAPTSPPRVHAATPAARATQRHPALFDGDQRRPAEPTPVHVHIGHIEIRAARPAPSVPTPPAAPRPQTTPAPDLAAYLAGRT